MYRWHALYGRRLRRVYSERRADGELVHVEMGYGVVIAVAAWMLDEATCAAFTLGPPRASVTALAELHRLLVEHCHRRRSGGPGTRADIQYLLDQGESRFIPGQPCARHFLDQPLCVEKSPGDLVDTRDVWMFDP